MPYNSGFSGFRGCGNCFSIVSELNQFNKYDAMRCEARQACVSLVLRVSH